MQAVAETKGALQSLSASLDFELVSAARRMEKEPLAA